MRQLPLLRAGCAALALAFALPAAAAQEIVPQPTPNADALAAQMRILASNPKDVSALIAAGELSAKLEDMPAAQGFFARAQAVDPSNPRLLAARASALVTMERPGEALHLFDQAERRGVAMTPYLAQRGLAYDLIGQPGYAQRDYRQALAIDSDDETTRRLALSLGISGQRDAAMTVLDPLLRRSDRAAWRARAFVLAMTGDSDGAQKIATSMIPGGGALTPFFGRLRYLSPADRAFAVHFGELSPTPMRTADARLAPALAPLPTTPVRQAAPVAVASNDAQEDGSRNRRDRRSRERAARNAEPVRTAARTAGRTPVPTFRRIEGTPVYSVPAPAPAPSPVTVAQRTPAPAPAPAPTPAPVPFAVAQRAPAPSNPMPSIANVERAATALASTGTAPGRTPFPTPSATTAGQGDTAPVATASNPPAPPTSSQPAPPTPVQVAAATPQPAPSYPTGVTLASSTFALPPGASTPAPVRETPPAASGDSASTLAPTLATAAPVRTPQVARRNTDFLASIIQTIDVPASELGVAPPVVAPPPPPPPPARVERTPPVEKPKPEPAPVEKAKPEPAAIKKAPAKKPEPKPAKPDPTKTDPARWWVQVAGGARADDLDKDWTRLAKKSPAAFRGKTAWTTPLRATNRLLAGPFKSQADAMTFVNLLAKDDISSFAWQSEAGQKIEKLDPK